MSTSAAKLRNHEVKPFLGWREWVVLGDLGPEPVKAKVDTGAATSALHADDLELREGFGFPVAHFVFRPVTGSDLGANEVSLPVVGFRQVRSSNGRTEQRPVVYTRAAIGTNEFELELTLTRRDEMGFRMLLGRRAVKNRFVVDVGRSFAASSPLHSVG